MRSLLLSIICVASSAPAASARLKELVDVQGSRDNALLGYGLVVGLTNTGDSEQVLFTMQSVAGMLGRLGVRVDPRDIRSRNVAAVMVTAKLPTFSRTGATIDVTVSAMGNARSLQGGTLLMTPLTGADGQTYAVAQGPVQVGGFDATGGFASVRKNTPTSSTIPGGATVERAVTPKMDAGSFTLRLKRADFTNAARIATAIEALVGAQNAKALDSAAVEVKVPDADKESPVMFLSKLEALTIEVDQKAKVVVSERTGTIVMGENVKLRPAAVSHGGLRISISTQFAVSQPPALSYSGQTVVAPVQQVEAEEAKRSAVAMPAASSVDDLVKALNAIGAPPRDLISILQALKAVGSLDAELEVM
ncbi:MAG: flagellar basal body P-ring protein FlgI [Archangium sp.]|nr:flagellar basal body P-ring protein FlgI [Archangium sp.]MDP3157972.1 flagellar basal body P-ring protein FlgI [Archangium sp.]MDP3574900.1 flagellar basal body P-ring protein FlgI [Archangium sp.]